MELLFIKNLLVFALITHNFVLCVRLLRAEPTNTERIVNLKIANYFTFKNSTLLKISLLRRIDEIYTQ